MRLPRLVVLLPLLAALLVSCALREGRAGKDAIWIATPDALVARMLQMAQVGPDDYVVDLGSGDGKIVIAAARDFGARGLGIEYDQPLVELSRQKAREAGVDHLARFERADIFEADYRDASVVTMYLLPNLTLRLRHTLMAMRPGTRITAHQFGLGDWTPDHTEVVEGRSGHLWIVPANAGGQWRVRVSDAHGERELTLAVRQRFQYLSGTLEERGARMPLRDARMEGAHIRFAYVDEGGREHRFEGRVDGARISGALGGGGRFAAQRIGEAPPIEGSTPVSAAEQDKARIDFH